MRCLCSVTAGAVRNNAILSCTKRNACAYVVGGEPHPYDDSAVNSGEMQHVAISLNEL